MAINATRTWPNGSPPNELWTWANLLTANTDGSPVKSAEHMDVTWQLVAANAGTSTIKLQGSNDGTNWFVLNMAAGGTPASFTASGGCTTLERPVYVRPQITTGGTAADWTVTAHMARKQ